MVVLRPKRLPRSTSILLLAVIYHSSADANFELTTTFNAILTPFFFHPDALVYITGDFNPVSTSFDEKHLKRLTGVTQVPTRSNSILYWCLVNMTKACFVATQLPHLG